MVCSRRHILVEVAVTIGFLLLRLVYRGVQMVKWRLDGTHRQLKQAAQCYEVSAQLLRVCAKHAFDPYELHNTEANFLLAHESFVHPEYVLQDEVSFYCLTRAEAIFVEAPPGVEVWRNKVDPFHKHGQHEYAVRVIKMPLSSFYHLAEHLGPVMQTLIFVEFIPRSGSTLLCKIFEETGEVVSYSEPHALNDMFGAYLTEDDPEGSKRAIAAQVRMLCKPRATPTTAFMFKMLPSMLQSKVLGPYLRQLYPDGKFLFLYRNGVPMARSLSRLLLQVNAVRLINVLKFMPNVWKRIRVWFVSIGQQFEVPVQEILEVSNHIEYLTAAVFWMLSVRAHLKDPKTPSIKYEDIVQCPEASIRAIFNYCGLSENLVAGALKAFEGDSQHDLALSWEELVRLGWTSGEVSSRSREAREETEALCQYLGVPDLTEDCILPSTITVNCMDNNNYL